MKNGSWKSADGKLVQGTKYKVQGKDKREYRSEEKTENKE